MARLICTNRTVRFLIHLAPVAVSFSFWPCLVAARIAMRSNSKGVESPPPAAKVQAPSPAGSSRSSQQRKSRQSKQGGSGEKRSKKTGNALVLAQPPAAPALVPFLEVNPVDPSCPYRWTVSELDLAFWCFKHKSFDIGLVFVETPAQIDLDETALVHGGACSLLARPECQHQHGVLCHGAQLANVDHAFADFCKCSILVECIQKEPSKRHFYLYAPRDLLVCVPLFLDLGYMVFWRGRRPEHPPPNEVYSHKYKLYLLAKVFGAEGMQKYMLDLIKDTMQNFNDLGVFVWEMIRMHGAVEGDWILLDISSNSTTFMLGSFALSFVAFVARRSHRTVGQRRSSRSS